MNNGILSKILVVIGSLALAAGAMFLVINFYNDETSIITDNKQIEKKDNSNDYNVDVELLRKEKKNSEIYGVLRIDEVEFYSILTRTVDNKYYLNHSLSGKKVNGGNPFIDYRNGALDDKEIVIYGSSSNKDFNKLTKLFNRDTFNKDIEMKLYLEDENATYELKFVKMSNELLTEKDLITSDSILITTYNDTTDKIETKEVVKEEVKTEEVKTEEKEEEEKEETKPESIFSDLYSNNKYCKDDCSIDDKDDVLVIEIINESSPVSNMVIIGVKTSK